MTKVATVSVQNRAAMITTGKRETGREEHAVDDEDRVAVPVTW
jgi:hypothetical protein